MSIDDRTSRLNLPLPNQDNFLEEDVQRLRDALSELDAKVATVDVSGKVPVEQLPAIAITDTFPVSGEAAMLALDAQPGDIAIRSDLSLSFILMEAPASNVNNWKELVNDALEQLAKPDGYQKIGGLAKNYGNIANTREHWRRNLAEAGLNLVSGSFEEGATANSKIDAVWHITEGQCYIWDDALPKYVASGSTPNSAGGIGSGKWLSVNDKKFTLKGTINPRYFKTIGDGLIDDTEAVRQAHELANAIGAKVSYSGIKQLAIQADARIPVNTSVDFCGCRFVILGGMVQNPSWSKPFLSVFLVADPAAPIVAATGTFSGSLKKGSVTPLGGLVDKPNCFAALRAPLQIPNRAATGTDDYEQSFATGPSGRVVYPLSVDLTGYENQLTVEYRVASTPITLSNAALENKNFNHLRFFDIQRNNVAINGFSMLSDNSAPAVTINEIVYLFKCANCSINNVNAVCQNLNASDGTYLLHYQYVASTHMSRIHAIGDSTTWSSMAGDHINGLLFSECLVRRIDVHAGCHNLLIDSCTLVDTGVSYGWGGGELRMSNCKVINAPALSTRGDFSGQHFGNIVIDGLTIERNNTVTHVIGQITCGANINTQLPDTIEIRNVTQVGVPSNFGGRLQLMVTRDATKTGQVQGPSSITIDGLNSFARCRFDATIDYGSFNRSANVFRHSLVVRDVVGLAQSSAKGDGIVIPAPSITPTTPCVLYIDVSNCDAVLVDTADSNVVRKIDISNSIVTGVATALGNNSPQVTLTDCDLEFAATGYGTNTPIGGDANSSNRYTRLQGCTVWPVSLDLSKVAAAQGCVFITGTPEPVIPPGWTFSDFFTGKKITYFRQ